MSPRLIAYAVAALALAGLLFAAHRVWVKAERLDAVEAEFKTYKADEAAREKKADEARANDALRRANLAATIEAKDNEINELRKHPPKASVQYVPVPGEPCPALRLDPGWLRDYNAAADASAVHHPH